MNIDETKYLMEALEEVKERDRIVKCNMIDLVLEIIDAEMDEVNCVEPRYWLRLNKMRGKVLALKEGEQESESEGKPSFWWKCERCGKLIPYMADFCHKCAYELLGEPPKPVYPQVESEDKK